MCVRSLTQFSQQLSKVDWEGWGFDAFFVLIIQLAGGHFFMLVIAIHSRLE
jgi:hypothetical protein